MDALLWIVIGSVVLFIGAVFYLFWRTSRKSEEQQREEAGAHRVSEATEQPLEPVAETPDAAAALHTPSVAEPPIGDQPPSGGGKGPTGTKGRGTKKRGKEWKKTARRLGIAVAILAALYLLVAAVSTLRTPHDVKATAWHRLGLDLEFAGIVLLLGMLWTYLVNEWRRGRRTRTKRKAQEAVDAFLIAKKKLLSEKRSDRRNGIADNPELQKLRSTRDESEALYRHQESLGQNTLVRLLAGNPTIGSIKISQFSLWYLVFMVLVEASVIREYGWLIGVLPILPFALFIRACIRIIPADPPHAGAYAFMGSTTNTEFGRGWIFLFPGLESVFLRNIQRRPLVIEPTEVRTKDNAEVELDLNIIWGPDPDDLKTNIENENVEQNLEDRAEEEARQFFYDYTDWFTDERTVMVRETDPEKIEKAKAKGVIPLMKDTQEYLREPWEDAQRIRSELRNHLALVITSHTHETIPSDRGVPDDHGWGIRIYGILVGEIKLAGETKKAADKRAKEVAERAGEVYEKETEAQQAEVLIVKAKELGHDLSFDRAYAMVVDYKTHEQDGAFRFSLPGMPAAIQNALMAFLTAKYGAPTEKEGGMEHGATSEA